MNRFLFVDKNLFLDFSQHVRFLRNTENALFEWLDKETTRYFTKSHEFFG
jgi:hypothetical protein